MYASPTSITVANARAALQAGLAAISKGETEVDFAPLQQIDSAAVATLLAWQRAAKKAGRTLSFKNLPDNLLSLMQTYGVEGLLGV